MVKKSSSAGFIPGLLNFSGSRTKRMSCEELLDLLVANKFRIVTGAGKEEMGEMPLSSDRYIVYRDVNQWVGGFYKFARRGVDCDLGYGVLELLFP